MQIETTIAKLLAMTDAVHAPIRSWHGNEQKNAYVRKRDFEKCGLPWRSDADSERGRKQAQRDLENAVASGLAAVFKPAKGRTLGARLTDEGDETARRLCGVEGVISAVLTIHILHGLQDHPETSAETCGKWSGYVPETLLAGKEYGEPGASREFGTVEELANVALLRGWIEWGADVHGRVSYRLADTGLGIATGKTDPPESSDYPDDYSRELREIYDRQFTLSRVWLVTDRPEKPSELGNIPLPASMLRMGHLAA